VRKLSAAVLAGVLLLSVSACGQSSSPSESSNASSSASNNAAQSPSASASVAPGKGKLADVKVESQDGGAKAPKVSVTESLEDGEAATARSVSGGEGEALKEGNALKLKLAYYSSADGSLQDDSGWSAPQSVELTENNFSGLGDAYKLLKAGKVGTEVLVYAPPTVSKSTGMLMLMHVESQSVPPKKASADEVAKLKADGALPTVTFAKDGKPSITIPKGKDAPADLIVEVLKEGKGKAATTASTVTAKYLGVNWAKGEKFDSSYDRTPDTSEFPLTGVIAGWTKGLTGVKEGSTVVLTIPQSMAYPTAAEGEKTHGPLVFVVELTKVS